MTYTKRPVSSYEVLKTTNTTHGLERRMRLTFADGDVVERWLLPTQFDLLEKEYAVYEHL